MSGKFLNLSTMFFSHFRTLVSKLWKSSLFVAKALNTSCTVVISVLIWSDSVCPVCSFSLMHHTSLKRLYLGKRRKGNKKNYFWKISWKSRIAEQQDLDILGIFEGKKIFWGKFPQFLTIEKTVFNIKKVWRSIMSSFNSYMQIGWEIVTMHRFRSSMNATKGWKYHLYGDKLNQKPWWRHDDSSWAEEKEILKEEG